MFEQLPLARQLDVVFREIGDELSFLDSGTVFVQIRNNIIGKFGVRHFFESRGGEVKKSQSGLSDTQQVSFRKMAVESLAFKRKWTHGEICFDFALRQGALNASVQFESNYNMAAVGSGALSSRTER